MNKALTILNKLKLNTEVNVKPTAESESELYAESFSNYTRLNENQYRETFYFNNGTVRSRLWTRNPVISTPSTIRPLATKVQHFIDNPAGAVTNVVNVVESAFEPPDTPGFDWNYCVSVAGYTVLGLFLLIVLLLIVLRKKKKRPLFVQKNFHAPSVRRREY
jgi:hypothetical protein